MTITMAKRSEGERHAASGYADRLHVALPLDFQRIVGMWAHLPGKYRKTEGTIAMREGRPVDHR